MTPASMTPVGSPARNKIGRSASAEAGRSFLRNAIAASAATRAIGLATFHGTECGVTVVP